VLQVTDGGLPTSFSWDFGDGQGSFRRSPPPRFSHPGTFTVTLTSTNANGSGSTSRRVRVSPAARCDCGHPPAAE
jgi:PKD repeat protein